jgi:hypothetical protein
VKLDRYDVICVMGLVLFCVGAWMIYHPLAFIVVGAFLVLVAIVSTKPKPEPKPNPVEGQKWA